MTQENQSTDLNILIYKNSKNFVWNKPVPTLLTTLDWKLQQ